MKAFRSESHTSAPFFFIIILIHLTTSVPLGNEKDHNALLAIKSQLVDRPHGILSSWNRSLHHCYWEGVTCGRKHNRVIALQLNSNGLAGTISPFIGNLSFLTKIWLFDNSLHGHIPPQIGHLSRLQHLSLLNNSLVGEIPANLSSCSNLRVIDIYGNELEGKLPPSLGTLTKLKHLNVGANGFSGPFFQVIANLTSLEYIYATYNAFAGEIHDSIGKMLNLSSLLVGANEFSGVVPSSIFSLSFLYGLDLAGNHLQGELPTNIGFTVPQLSYLNLARNNFTGSIPNTITNLSTLEFVDLSANKFTGRIPHNLGYLKNLGYLDVSMNYLLEGDINLIISSLVNCTQLQKLHLQGNHVTGVLPKSIANLSTTLIWLSIADLPIRGTIPAGITNLINLISLTMHNTELSGSLPRNFGKLHKLENIVLRSNKLTGRLPYSMGNLSHVSMLDMQDNKLEGSIPRSIGSCQYLEYLFLQKNKLTGTLPRELFEGAPNIFELFISQNKFEGSLPTGISKQEYLVQFVVSDNKFSGVIPDELGDCLQLQTLYMDGNSFHGYIPPSLYTLSSLERVDLSRNNLTGAIPPFFSRIPSLFYLNLSFNQLEGWVPTDGVFENASAVFLTGNSKLCGGISALHLPKCIADKERRMSPTIKAVISTVCTLAGVLALAIALYLTCVRNKRKLKLPGLSMEKQFSKVSYDTLLKATDGFSRENLLGEGTFGSVFKGNLDGRTVAVKVLNLQQQGASKSFMAECKALRSIRHRNLMKIITVCSSIDFQGNEFRALVYEFMPNGSLDGWLHGARNLTLSQRLDIAIDVAHALEYLHHGCDTPIVHCDLKPRNILLDNNMVAHVGDFGLAKFLAQPNQSSSTIGLRGTIGYAAPGNFIIPAFKCQV